MRYIIDFWMFMLETVFKYFAIFVGFKTIIVKLVSMYYEFRLNFSALLENQSKISTIAYIIAIILTYMCISMELDFQKSERYVGKDSNKVVRWLIIIATLGYVLYVYNKNKEEKVFLEENLR